jgi:YD repeat-containing protein
MKVTYDSKTDTLSIVFKEGMPVAESDEEKPGIILDYDAAGNLISMEILDASIRVSETRKIEFQMTA